MAAIGIRETGANLRNKISRGRFTGGVLDPMSGGNGRSNRKTGRLALLAAVSAVLVVLGFVAWNVRTDFKQALYHAYPEAQLRNQRGADAAKDGAWVNSWEAWYADAALDVAVFQLILGLIGIGGLMFTVHYARQAWEAAERSAGAAVEALEAQIESERPWVRVELEAISGIQPEPNKADGSCNIFCRVKMENIGHRVAKNVRASVYTCSMLDPNVLQWTESLWRWEDIKPDSWKGLTILPTEKRSMNTFANFTGEVMRSKAEYVIVNVSYADTGSRHHHTTVGFGFGFRPGGAIDENGRLIPIFEPQMLGNDAD